MADKLKVNVFGDKIVRLLAIIIVVLTAAHVVGQLTRYLTSHDTVFGLISKFNLDVESNVPTYFSSLMLLIISILLGIISLHKKRTACPFFVHWTSLSVIFFVLSMDEIAGFHEGLSSFLDARWETSGYFHYPWVIPAMFFVFIFIMLFFKFWLNLPKKTRLLFLISGAIYISGAIGLELIGGNYADMHGDNTLAFSMITAVEELLEMLGCLCFIYALFQYIEEHVQDIQICFIGKNT